MAGRLWPPSRLPFRVIGSADRSFQLRRRIIFLGIEFPYAYCSLHLINIELISVSAQVPVASRTFEGSSKGYFFELVESRYFREFGCPFDTLLEIYPNIVELAAITAFIGWAIIANEHLPLVSDAESSSDDQFFASVLSRVSPHITEANHLRAACKPREQEG